MRPSMINKALNYLDDDLVFEAVTFEPVKRKHIIKGCALAACLALIIAAAAAIPALKGDKVPPSPGKIDAPLQSDALDEGESAEPTPVHNLVDKEIPAVFTKVNAVLDGARRYIPGYFTEELSEGDLEAICPPTEDSNITGFAGFDGEGKLVGVHLSVTQKGKEDVITVSIAQGAPVRDYVFDGNIVVYANGDTVFQLYEWENGSDNVTLTADAVINDLSFAFTMQAKAANAEAAKERFVSTLQLFANYEGSKPDLSLIKARSIPQWFDREISYEEALEDADFGKYMLPVLPAGFAEESLCVYKNQNNDYLSGLWVRGYDELRWKVYTFGEEDELRLTGSAQKENYDLSLYPIPRADSVPDELRQIVDNPIFSAEDLTLDMVRARAYSVSDSGDSSGPRMTFSVKYGDTVVEVRSKGIDPQWIYEQLISLK